MLSLLAALTLSLAQAEPPLLLAHYMPWYENKPVSGKWGWHWTMNHFDPDKIVGGRQEAASQYRPLIGLYDSGDPAVVEYQALLMKIAGLDGAIIDWYGDQDHFDYLNNDRNTVKVITQLDRVGLKHAILYEDQTVPQMIKGGKFTAEQAVENGRALMRRTEKRWFGNPNYVRLDGHPLLLVFGPQYYKDADWTTILGDLKPSPAFFTLMFKRGDAAIGAFSWPTPQKGEAFSWKELDLFNERAKTFRYRVDVAYPRFYDIYKEAGMSGYPEITDRDGQTYRDTLNRALAASPQVIQVATWNDWGEGTQIEPSKEFGYRDLEETQKVRRRLAPAFTYQAADLRLPVEILNLRRSRKGDREAQLKLDQVVKFVVGGKSKAARNLLKELE